MSRFDRGGLATEMESRTEERRLAIEIIATLVHMKNAMAELVLRPAGVPSDICKAFLYRRDEVTGRPLSKRQIAPLILDALDTRPDCARIIRQMIEIGASWHSFHLAADEFAARATVQKAREMLGTIELMEAREAQQRDLARREALAQMEFEKVETLRKQSELLLMMFDEIARNTDHQRRGYLLQDLLNRLFDLHEIPVFKAFARNEGGEQIDGGFTLEGWHYLVECRWREKLANIQDLDGLMGKVRRSGKQTMGLFLSISGWSENVLPLLKQNPEKSILLMDGYGLRMVLSNQLDLRDFILAMGSRLSFQGDPFLSIQQYFKDQDI